MFKFSHALFAAASALAFTAGSAQAQDGGLTGIGRGDAVGREYFQNAPVAGKYMVRATTLYANDETGSDWAGADEIYAIFVLRRPDRLGSEEFYARTSVFHNFDTGETKRFRDGENCLTGVMPAQSQLGNSPVRFWDCHPAGERYNMQFRVRLYEEDVGDDDFIGERTISWSHTQLDEMRLAVGQTRTEHTRIGGYTMSWEIIRVA